MLPRPQIEGKNYRPAGKLQGKVAIITGGDSGIGAATAIAFAKEGADVAIAYLQEHQDADHVKQLVAQQGRQCLGIAGHPEEIAPCYVFLASEDSSYMTGQVLHPNGGEVVNA